MIISADDYSLNLQEFEFLRSHLRPTDSVFEWGVGATTTLFSAVCRRVVSVEHIGVFSARSILALRPNAALYHIPTDLPVTDQLADGDYETFRSYVDCYQGQGIDVVLIDGRARVACARRVAETAPFGPHPGMRIFLHDWDRKEYAAIYSDPDGYFRMTEAVGRLALMEPKP